MWVYRMKAAAESWQPFESITLKHNTYYGMNGSFVRGDAAGSAMSPDISVCIDTVVTHRLSSGMFLLLCVSEKRSTRRFSLMPTSHSAFVLMTFVSTRSSL